MVVFMSFFPRKTSFFVDLVFLRAVFRGRTLVCDSGVAGRIVFYPEMPLFSLPESGEIKVLPFLALVLEFFFATDCFLEDFGARAPAFEVAMFRVILCIVLFGFLLVLGRNFSPLSGSPLLFGLSLLPSSSSSSCSGGRPGFLCLSSCLVFAGRPIRGRQVGCRTLACFLFVPLSARVGSFPPSFPSPLRLLLLLSLSLLCTQAY